MDVNKVIHGDCFEVMRGLPDDSVDMVLTDPPYNMTACKWDVEIAPVPLAPTRFVP